MERDQLNQEIKEKVKEGIKPSDLKKKRVNKVEKEVEINNQVEQLENNNNQLLSIIQNFQNQIKEITEIKENLSYLKKECGELSLSIKEIKAQVAKKQPFG